MSRGFPEDIQRMSKGHPEGSKGSPEEWLGMYSNAYISMSRNHKDSDLKCNCADRYQGNQESSHSGTVTVGKQQHQQTIFKEKKYKGCQKDVRMTSRGCRDKDSKKIKMSRGCYCADRWYHKTRNIHTVELRLWKNNNSIAFFDKKKIQKMSGGCQKYVRLTSRRCTDKDSKKIVHHIITSWPNKI